MAYVYFHRRKDNGKVFYIGKGSGKRAWSENKRNRHWKSVVKKCGYEVEIIENNLSNEDAYRKEIELISEYGLDTLTNILPGGEGTSSDQARKNCRKLYSDDIHKSKLSFLRKEQWKDDGYRRKRSEFMKRYWSDEKNRKLVSQKIKAKVSTPECFRKKSEISKKLWENENYRNAISQKNKRKVVCDRCGMLLGICNLKRHQTGPNCIQKVLI